MEPMRIYKFGGPSMGSPSNIKQVCEIIKRDKPGIVVVSAPGDSTNILELLAEGIFKNDKNKINSAFNKFKKTIEDIIDGLFDQSIQNRTIRETSREIMNFLSTFNNYGCNFLEMTKDRITVVGEFLSSQILFHQLLLNEDFQKISLINATGLIFADMNFGEANVDRERSISMIRKGEMIRKLDAGNTIITQGFIAITAVEKSGYFSIYSPVTLGREGSDYSAALIASFVSELGTSVEEVVLWKDVSGVFRINPKNISKGNKPYNYKKLKFAGLQKMINPGGSAQGLVHPKTLRVLKEAKIPLRIKSFLQPELPGTLIS